MLVLIVDLNTSQVYVCSWVKQTLLPIQLFWILQVFGSLDEIFKILSGIFVPTEMFLTLFSNYSL